MKTVAACALGVSCLLLAGTASRGQNLWHSSPWLGFNAGETISVESGQYRLTQKYEVATQTGEIYVQRGLGEEPRLIFKNQRSTEILIGDRGERALINYSQSTKPLFEVYIADLGSGESWRIDQQALRMFSANSGAAPSLIVVAAGEALSPDDQQALLSVNLIYTQVSSKEEAARAQKTFKKWWYAVSTSTGEVVHEYETASVPREWRAPYRISGKHLEPR